MRGDMRRFAAVAVPVLLVLLLAIWRAQGPSPKPANAPPNEFSSARAMATLQELVGNGVAHPIGTSANRHVRDLIYVRLRALGYRVDMQQKFACTWLPACGYTENLIAKLPDAKGAEVMLVAHYDSVPAGPGATDDGAGVASLIEIARAVKSEKHRNPITFLITDGEEGGLLGAEAFVAEDYYARNAKVMVDVENRGTYGPSNMFETSRHNRWLIRHLARSLERPHATSFFYAIYTLLPNDTDVTVFKRAGKAAVNFAAIRGVNWYHSPLDDIEHVNARTLQHHGDNLLETARGLADADLDAQSNDDASYFDILQFTMVWWPAGATTWICVASLVLLVFAARKTNPRAMTFGVLAMFAAILISLFAGGVLSWLARLRSDGVNWVAHPLPSILAMALIGIAASLFAAALFRKWSDERAMLFGAAFVWHAIAFVLAITITGASYLFLVPALVLTICALARANETVISAVTATAAAIIFCPLVILFYDALGGRMMTVIAIFVAILTTLVAPLFARLRLAAITAVLASLCTVIALVLPQWTREKPRFLSLAYVSDRTMSPVWVAPMLTPTLEGAARWKPADPRLTPWYRGQQWTAPAPPLPAFLRPVEMSAQRDGQNVIIDVRTHRKANRIVLAIRGGTVLMVNGVKPAPLPARHRDQSFNGWRFVIANAVDEIAVQIHAPGEVEAIASDLTWGFWSPPSFAVARQTSNTIPQGDGDVAITRDRLKIAASP
jgi:peptidase M28-like protein